MALCHDTQTSDCTQSIHHDITANTFLSDNPTQFILWVLVHIILIPFFCLINNYLQRNPVTKRVDTVRYISVVCKLRDTTINLVQTYTLPERILTKQ